MNCERRESSQNTIFISLKSIRTGRADEDANPYEIYAEIGDEDEDDEKLQWYG